MSRRYPLLFAAVLLLAIGVSALARIPLPAPRAASPAPPAPLTELAIALENGRVIPESASVPKGNRVELHVVNRGRGPATLALAGYEDRVTLESLSPGAERRLEFLADRPGEDFAWLLDGRPAGRLRVTGSHLEEGHR